MSAPDKILYKGATYVKADEDLPEKIQFRGEIYKIALGDVPPPNIPPKVEKKPVPVVEPNIEKVETAPLAKGVVDRLQQTQLLLPEGLLEAVNLSIQNAIKQSGINMRMASAEQLQLKVALWPKTKSRMQPSKRPLSQANPADLAKQFAMQIASALKDSVARALKSVGKESDLEGSLTRLQGKLADNLAEAFAS